jgi:hypothetical protein
MIEINSEISEVQETVEVREKCTDNGNLSHEGPTNITQYELPQMKLADVIECHLSSEGKMAANDMVIADENQQVDNSFCKDGQKVKMSVHMTIATRFLLLFQIMTIIVFFLCVETKINTEDFTGVYNMYTGILIMVFFGFGYLYSFLKRYGLGAVGFSALITIIAMEWGVITEVICCDVLPLTFLLFGLHYRVCSLNFQRTIRVQYSLTSWLSYM